VSGGFVSRRSLLGLAGLASLSVVSCGATEPDGTGRTVRWSNELDSEALLQPMSVVVATVAGSKRLLVNHGGHLSAFDPASGKQVWTSSQGATSVETRAKNVILPVLLDDSVCVLRSFEDGPIKCIDATTGKLKWEYGETGTVCRALAGNGQALVVTATTGIVALDVATGKSLWNRGGSGATFGAYGKPAVGDGRVYGFGDFVNTQKSASGSCFYALDARTGKAVWIQDAGTARGSDQPFAYGSGVVCSFVDDGTALIAMDATTGKQMWKESLANNVAAVIPAVIGSDTVLVAAESSMSEQQGRIMAFNRADGAFKWSLKPSGKVDCRVTVQGTVAYVSSKGSLQAVNLADGTPRWEFTIKEKALSAAAVGDGLVYVLAEAGGSSAKAKYRLYALSE
jgi:outer membrane protein assembly factor BamB